MTDKPEALFLADALEVALDTVISGDVDKRAAAELRRLHNVNEELVNALKLALWSHGTMLLSDPPQDAWKTYGVEAKARAAIAKAEDKP